MYQGRIHHTPLTCFMASLSDTQSERDQRNVPITRTGVSSICG